MVAIGTYLASLDYTMATFLILNLGNFLGVTWVVMILIIILVVASLFSKYNILNTIIAHEQWMGDCVN
jgi:hypothetical protein